MVCRIPGAVRTSYVQQHLGVRAPFTMSFTDVGSANTSRIYSGGFRGSIEKESDGVGGQEREDSDVGGSRSLEGRKLEVEGM
jgi:hypothetical protein